MKYLVLLFPFLVATVSCQSSTKPPAVDQFVEGEMLYNAYCASCHEIDNGIGPKLTKDVVATRVNAQLLYNYNKRNMPYEAGNTLTQEQYWSITAYMLIRDGFLEKDVALNAENASAILLSE